jgi:hypothetical protein
VSAPPSPTRASFRRDLRWLAVHGTWGLLLSAIGVTLIVNGAQDFTYPLWWRMLPAESATPSFIPWTVRDANSALAVGLYGLALAVCFLIAGPWLARLQAWHCRRLLAPAADADLSLRVAQLSTTAPPPSTRTPRSCAASNARCTTGRGTGSSPSPSWPESAAGSRRTTAASP